MSTMDRIKKLINNENDEDARNGDSQHRCG